MFPIIDFNPIAVIPSALGPLQALIAILPHLIVILTTAMVALFKPKSYRALFRYFWTHKVLTLICVAIIAAFVFGGAFIRGKAADEKNGAPWTAFRGGPERTGATSGARGPFGNARTQWNYSRSSPGNIEAIDSSPTVVGNRIYVGSSIQTPFAKSGAIVCLDTDTGAEVWRFTGAGMDRPLQPIFSSPSVGGENGRYLVCGEGYHVEDDSRIFCLDLEPVRASKGKEPPAFKWSIQVTNHAESSPTIFENKVYAGTGDDGWWCIDLPTGKVKWHLEGCEHYVVTDGPQVEALAKMNGKFVAVNGSPKRVRPNKKENYDFSIMFLDATEFSEVAPGTTYVRDPAQPVPGNERRTVIGKVVVGDSPFNPEQHGSRVKIEMEKFYPDAECDPLAIRVDGQPRLFCGSGMEGQAAICIDAETGSEVWRVKTREPVFGAPAVVDGKVFVGMSNGTFAGSNANPAGGVVALAAADGKILWDFKTPDGVLGAIAIKDNAAYACCLNGSLYVIDVRDGKLIRKFDSGAKLFCSPTVTSEGVYLCTNLGKVFGLKRDTLAFQWSLNITQGKPIFSSPSVTDNRLFVGSAESGVFCLSEDSAVHSARTVKPVWSGRGGNAEHSNVADERGPPGVDGNKSDRVATTGSLASAAISGPMAACGNALYFPAKNAAGKNVLACMDSAKRSDRWQSEIGRDLLAIAANETHVFAWVGSLDGSSEAELLFIDASSGAIVGTRRKCPSVQQPFLCLTSEQLIFKASASTLIAAPLKNLDVEKKIEIGEIVWAPVLKHNLMFVAIAAPSPKLLCLDDFSHAPIWSADLPAKPISGPSIAGDTIVVAVAGSDGNKNRIVRRNLTDGGNGWETPVDKTPVSDLATSDGHIAFTAADGTVVVLDAKTGEQSHTVLLGKGSQAPAMFHDSLFLAGDNRAGAFDLASSSWSWGFREQKTLGRVWTAPILAGEIVWVLTEKQGLIAIGGKDEKK